MKINKRLKFILKLAVSAGFVVWIIFKVNWSEVWLYISRIKIWHVFIYGTLVICGNVISSKKWKILSEYKGIRRPFKDFFKFYLAGTFINNFMPSILGGDTFRAFQIGKEEKRYLEAASTVMVDRITGLLGFIILAVFFSLLNIRTIMESEILLFIDFLALLVLIFYLIFIKIKELSFWQKIVGWFPEKIRSFIQEIDHYNQNSGILFRSIGWSLFFALIGVGAANLVLFWSLGVKVGVLNYLSVIFLVSIVSAIPVSINNIGVKEWAYVTFFGFFGIGASVVIAIAIISRFLQMLLSFLALPVYLESKVNHKTQSIKHEA